MQESALQRFKSSNELGEEDGKETLDGKALLQANFSVRYELHCTAMKSYIEVHRALSRDVYTETCMHVDAHTYVYVCQLFCSLSPVNECGHKLEGREGWCAWTLSQMSQVHICCSRLSASYGHVTTPAQHPELSWVGFYSRSLGSGQEALQMLRTYTPVNNASQQTQKDTSIPKHFSRTKETHDDARVMSQKQRNTSSC